jgi:hypothetical protein
MAAPTHRHDAVNCRVKPGIPPDLTLTSATTLVFRHAFNFA